MITRWAAGVAVSLALGGCAAVPASGSLTSPPVLPAASPSPSPTPTPQPSPEPAPASSSPALTALGTLPVKGRAPKTGYDRDLFGQAWADVDRNGCDTRNDMLNRDLTGKTFRPGTRDCVVLSGTLADPYTGQVLTFAKANAGAIQIDHVVALSDAWQKGAQQWDVSTRQSFANDPLNLLAVDGPTNGSKSDGDAATWLPPNKSYRCPMVARQVAVKAKYALWVTAAERDAIARVLQGCPEQSLPDSSARPDVAPVVVEAPPVPAGEPPPASVSDPNYGSCREAKANGAGPYVQGQDPEYGFYRDGDSDGTVCE